MKTPWQSAWFPMVIQGKKVNAPNFIFINTTRKISEKSRNKTDESYCCSDELVCVFRFQILQGS